MLFLTLSNSEPIGFLELVWNIRLTSFWLIAGRMDGRKPESFTDSIAVSARSDMSIEESILRFFLLYEFYPIN